MKQVLTRNIGLKILSLFLAMLLWIVIMSIDDPYITKTINNISVTIINANAIEDNNKMYEVDSGDTASIKIRGKRSVIDSIRGDDFNAIADFNQMSMTYAVPIYVSVKESSKYSENDVEIMKQTEMMVLSLEDSDAQTFRINVVTTGKVKEGYYVADTIAAPNLVEISGSKKQIAKIKEVVVEVDVNEKQESYNVIVSNPIARDENGYAVDSSKLNFETKDIEVDVTVLPTKEISLYVTQKGDPFYGYECTSLVYKPEKITIAGELEDLNAISYISIPFSVEGLRETKVTDLSIEEYLDEKYILVDENKSVAVTAKIEKLVSKDVMVRSSDINIKNLSSDYEVLFVTKGTITLRVLGLTETLEKVVSNNVGAFIDLKGYSLGTYYVPVKSDAGSEITVRPSTIGIEIVEKDS